MSSATLPPALFVGHEAPRRLIIGYPSGSVSEKKLEEALLTLDPTFRLHTRGDHGGVQCFSAQHLCDLSLDERTNLLQLMEQLLRPTQVMPVLLSPYVVGDAETKEYYLVLFSPVPLKALDLGDPRVKWRTIKDRIALIRLRDSVDIQAFSALIATKIGRRVHFLRSEFSSLSDGRTIKKRKREFNKAFE